SYQPPVEANLNPNRIAEGGAPAVHFIISTAMMNQRLENWLLADDPEHGKFSMGLATIELKRGTAENINRHPERSAAEPREPVEVTSKASARDPSTSLGMTELADSIFAFRKARGERTGRVRRGGST